MDSPQASESNTRARLQSIISLIDLTLLDKHASAKTILALANKANTHQVAALCIYPEHLDFIPQATNKSVPCATVINFPEGNKPQSFVLQELMQALTHQQVREIDYVFPYAHYLAKQTHQALAYCQELYQLCQTHDVLFKVILETGAWPDTNLLYQAALAIIDAGCDFLKTSTGKINIGATLQSAQTLLNAIVHSKKNCGIKISGGIKTIEQAFNYINLAEQITQKKVDKSWFRIGASRLLDDLLLALRN